MNYWLVKSEPSVWSWDQQVAKGAKGEAWTGVRNFTARQNLVNMKKGDKAFFYPEGIAGLFEICYAPADTFETVNTLGQPLYARIVKEQPDLLD